MPNAPYELSISDEVRLSSEGETRSLRRRFILAISALVGLVLMAQAAVLLVFGRHHLEEEIETQAYSFSALAVDPICDAFELYFESGLSKFHQIVGEVAALNGDLDQLAIYDIEGRRLFPLPGEAEGEAFPPQAEGELLEGLRELETRTFEALDEEGVRRLIVVEPRVEEWGRHRYSVVFHFSYRGLRRAMLETYWQIGGLALFALLLGVACAFLLSAQSLGPVERLTQGARRLADGDLEVRIGLRTGDEFETLGATLDLMAGRLADTVEDLEISNEQLARLNRELRELDRVKSDLLANVSHELRTPLTAISGYVEAMSSGLLGDLEPDQSASLEVMERNIRRLRGMIDQLLNYSRMESGRLEVDLQRFDLEPVARHVMEAVQAAQGEGTLLRLHCPEELPEVYGDSARIAQVIENLLTNAVKFSASGEPVDLRLRDVDQGVEVSVRDRGIGIPQDLQDKIFERFYQIDATARRKFGGMGIGLALVRELLELNHSRIEVESQPGEGATFRFVLPLASERTGRLAIGHTRVALIDDDTGFVQQTAAHLSRRGFAVETAASAEQGWRLVKRSRPDVVLLDRLLPDDDGFALLQRLKKRESTRGIPVVLATVRQEKALGLRLGAEEYLTKPLDPEAVEDALRTALGGGSVERPDPDSRR